MGKLVNHEATFRTESIVDGGLGETSTGLPQLVLSLRADEIYDFEEKVWVPWDDVEEREVTAYLVLVGKKGNEIFHCKSIEKALGWDGLSFATLAAIDFQNMGVQFTTKENEYNDNVTIQVAGIDHYDAEPGRTVQKLDAAEVKGLDAKYASFFRNRAGEKKPKPVGKPVVPVVKLKKEPETDTVGGGVPDTSPKKVTEEAEVPPPKAAKKLAKKIKKAKGCTQTEAWVACKKAKYEAISDEKLVEIWVKTVEVKAPEGDEDQISPELWSQIRDIVVAQVIDDIPF